MLSDSEDEDIMCWCPCRCGWKKEDLLPNGLCPDCQEGNHEVPPENVIPGVDELLAQYESICEQLRKIIKDRGKSIA